MHPVRHPLPLAGPAAPPPPPPELLAPNAGPNTFALLDFGCKTNAWDGREMRAQLLRAGLREVDPEAARPDVVVVNSCTVTGTADREALAAIRKIRREHPAARIVASGCMADISPDQMLAAARAPACVTNDTPGRAADAEPLLLPTREKSRLLDHLGLTPADAAEPPVALAAPTASPLELPAGFGHSRAFVKIEDGCDLCCAFCIIPRARGTPRSRPPEEICAEVERLAAQGFREIILTGIHLGAYGKDFSPGAHFAGANSAKRGPNRVAELLERLIALPTRVRFRISSLEVTEFDEHLLELIAAAPNRICPHLHLPLQAGDDRILKAMRRWYTRADFRAAVDRYRRAVPDGALSTDVIVGFPGEDRAAFENTRRFLSEIAFSRLHVFPYSPREKNVAARLPGQLPWAERKARAADLRALGVELSRAFHAAFIGRSATVVLEPHAAPRAHAARPGAAAASATHATPAGWSPCAGYTERYIPIRTLAPAAWLRRAVHVRLGSPLPDTAADHLAPALAATLGELAD